MFLILQRYCSLQTLGDRTQSVFRYESLKLKSMSRYTISIDSFSVMKMGSTGAVIVALNDKDG